MATVTKTIGSASRDYSTIVLWEADLDNVAVYGSGDTAIGECYDDSAFTAGVLLNGGGTVGLTAITLRAATAERHDGTAGTGARTVNGTTNTEVFNSDSAVATIDVSWLEFDNAGLAHGGSGSAVVNQKTVVTSNTFHHLLIHDAVEDNRTAIGLAMFDYAGVCHNNIIYDIADAQADTDSAYGLSATLGGTIYNTTIFNIINAAGTGACQCFALRDVSGDNYRNNLAAYPNGGTTGSIACFEPATFASATCDYNAATDTTAYGTNSLDSITYADCFVSTVNGSEDLRLKSGAPVIDEGVDLGTTPANVQYDITGYDRDAGGVVWDIGADEYVAAAGGVPKQMDNILRSTWA